MISRFFPSSRLIHAVAVVLLAVFLYLSFFYRRFIDGIFEIRNVPYGKYTLSLSGENLEDKELAIELNSETLMLPVVEMKRKAGETEGISEISTVILDQEDENKEQNVSGLLHSSEDVFTSTAGYIFGSISFRPRGYDNENNSVLINGTDVSDPENGRVSFTDWGGLNDAMRNKEVFTYTSSAWQ